MVGLGVTLWAVGGHDVGLVAEQAQHNHSGGELGHYHDGDLALALPIHFLFPEACFLSGFFLPTPTSAQATENGRTNFILRVRIFRIFVCCCVDSEDDTIGYGCVLFCNRKNDN